jgi:hypothetical protein
MNVAAQDLHQPFAWRIDFADRKPIGEAIPIRQPRTVWLRLLRVDAAAALGDTAAPESATDGLTLVFVASGAATPYEIQKQAEAWIARRPGEDGASLEVQLRSERLLWRRGRAVCFGSPSATQDILSGVSLFSFCEGELAALERKLQDCWSAIERDTALMTRLSSRSLKRLRDVDAMARMATAMRVAYVRLQTALETPPRELTAPARRLFLELALQADTLDRLRMADDAIEVFEEFYKHIREQFSEFRYFVKEYRVEVLILLALLGDSLASIQTVQQWFASIMHWVSTVPMLLK